MDGRYEVHGHGRLWKLEIDRGQADWLGPAEMEPPTEAARLAEDLRLGRQEFPFAKLLKLARQEDPFVAQAALSALARVASTWKSEDIQKLSAQDRVQAVLALKLAAGCRHGW